MNKQKYAEQYGRYIKDDEIVFDFDNREKGDEAVFLTSILLATLKYNFEVWKAKGQKSAHIHIKNIQSLDLDEEQLKNYKKIVLRNYAPQESLEYLDIGLTGKHRIAEENKLHYKYKTPKLLLESFNEDKINYAVKEFINEAKKIIIENKDREINSNGNGITAQIVSKISIIDIAREYGIKVRGNKAVCPFHADSNPSLCFDDSRGWFKCFGCNVRGNIIDFISLLREQYLKGVKQIVA